MKKYIDIKGARNYGDGMIIICLQGRRRVNAECGKTSLNF
jgi:hypothetical protein